MITGMEPFTPPPAVVAEVVRVASLSPCGSKRGVVIWREVAAGDPEILGTGFNAPPAPYVCTGGSCIDTCARTAIHAEEEAIFAARGDLVGAHMLHVKVVAGKAVSSNGGPSCWQCSRKILRAGIATMALLYDDGWRRWSALDFHRDTLMACGLPSQPAQMSA